MNLGNTFPNQKRPGYCKTILHLDLKIQDCDTSHTVLNQDIKQQKQITPITEKTGTGKDQKAQNNQQDQRRPHPQAPQDQKGPTKAGDQYPSTQGLSFTKLLNHPHSRGPSRDSPNHKLHNFTANSHTLKDNQKQDLFIYA